MKDELFKSSQNINVFTINWSSRGMYINVIKKISDTSKEIYHILNHLNHIGLFRNISNSTNIHCIGHSLGAHVCGLLSKLMNSLLNLKFKRITGLDPAGPCFKNYNSNNKLDKTDADYVDVIHTSNMFGIQDPIGYENCLIFFYFFILLYMVLFKK